MTTQAQNLLSNGDFELGIIEDIPGFELFEAVSDNDPDFPGVETNAGSIIGFADNPGGGFGFWLRAFQGGVIDLDGDMNNDNRETDTSLTQTVAATPGETYTFSIDGSFEGNYSGGVPILDPTSPSGSVPSPTSTFARLEFLDGGGAVVGSATGDVALDVFNGFGYTAVTPVTAVAPAGTVSARVTAGADSMVINVDPGQSAFLDNFSLTASSDPSTELLTNGDLNLGVVQTIPGWEFIEQPDGTDNLQLAGFANNTTGGAFGVWVRSFAEGDATVQSETVAASEGDEFEFSAQALFEAEYSGGDPLQPTETLLQLTYLDGSDQEISSDTFDVASVVSNGGGFTPVSLMGTAPAGTAGVRASVVLTDLVNTMGGQSAFFDDLVLELVGGGFLLGDADGDGDVDGDDLIAVQTEFGATGASPLLGDADGDGDVDGDDLIAVQTEFGSTLSVAVPEPTAAVLAALAAAGLLARRRGA